MKLKTLLTQSGSDLNAVQGTNEERSKLYCKVQRRVLEFVTQ